MKAKDTVMTQDEFEVWCGNHNVKGCGKTRDMCERVCRPLAQAEISFKAGIDEEAKRGIERCAMTYGDGRQTGIREVVDEYNAVRACTHMAGYHYLRDCKECLQVQLEKWGIK